MSVHRFHLPAELCLGSRLRLPKAESHHALHVLRLRPGDAVTVLDGEGHELKCSVSHAEKHALELEVHERREIPPLPGQITLIQAVPKQKAMDYIIQKATELGITSIVPVITARCVSQPGEDKLEKWHAVAVEAIKQCGSPWLPRMFEPLTFAELLQKHAPVDLSLIATWAEDSRQPRFYFEEFRRKHGRPPVSVNVWIGPEGDFTPDEVAKIRSIGARPITLGRNVLRSDTAAIYTMSIISYELQSL